MAFKKGEKPKNWKGFQKGQSGNPKGRPKTLPSLEKALIAVLGETKDNLNATEAILTSLRNRAIKGDNVAAKILLDRGYGLPEQKLNLDMNFGADEVFVGKKKEE